MIHRVLCLLVLYSGIFLQPRHTALAQESPFSELRIGMPKDSALACFAGKFLLFPMPTPFWHADTTYIVSDFRGSRGNVGMVRCDSSSVVTIAENIGPANKDPFTVDFLTQLCDLISPFTKVSGTGEQSAKIEIALRDLKGSGMGKSRRLKIVLNDTTLINLDIFVPSDPTTIEKKVTVTKVRHKLEPSPLNK